MKTKLYLEECCEICHEIIHCHFDCPICNEKKSSTDMYGDSYLNAKEFSCEKCKTGFKILSREKETVEIEEVKNERE